jgi:HAD superfamily hydrolase (TIGR01450 family)
VFDFSPYAAVFLDLDGTIYHEHDVLPGAVELVTHLRTTGRRFACLTNSNSNPREIHERLLGMGIDIPATHIYSAVAAAADFVVRHLAVEKRPRLFNLASGGLEELLEDRVVWVKLIDEPCDAVMAGAATSSYATPDRQWQALQLLRAGAALIGTCADRVFPSPRGMEFGSGAMSMMLAYAANIRPTFCGKPELIFFDELCNRLNVRSDKCILIGDNLESDIAGARAVGMATVLTLSGVSREKDLIDLPAEKMPGRVITSLADLL